MLINALLKGRISAKFAPASVLAMAFFVVVFSVEARNFTPAPDGGFYGMNEFFVQPQALVVMATLFAIAVIGRGTGESLGGAR